LKLLVLPIILYFNWAVLAPYVAPGRPNPFAAFLFLSHPIPTSTPGDQRYAKGYLDLVYIAYHVVVWSFVRQIVTVHTCRPIAKYFGLKKEAKITRFGEQGYALLYWTTMSVYGTVSPPLCLKCNASQM
jgi:very-long-chain ceramide synthase